MKNNFQVLVYFFASLIIIGFFAKSLALLVKRAEPAKELPDVSVSCDTVSPGENYTCRCINDVCLWIQK